MYDWNWDALELLIFALLFLSPLVLFPLLILVPLQPLHFFRCPYAPSADKPQHPPPQRVRDFCFTKAALFFPFFFGGGGGFL